ncbi:MAG: Asp-tRNA(Asn)/Glu-tRNA(Gln) amidotransferase subunit GatA, partial [Candidatus Zixiibacteriota bacterium]
LVAFASSTDQISPFARNVYDLALAYKVPAGRDENDSTSVAFEHPDYPALVDTDRKFTIGLPPDYFTDGLDVEVERRVREALARLEADGHKIVEVSLPSTCRAIAVYYIVACAEASSNLARFDGVKYGLREAGDSNLMDMYCETRGKGFGREVKRRIMLGTYVLSSGYYDAYYHKAGQVRELMRREFDEVFEKVDLIVSPTSPTPAFELGERIEDPLAMYLSDCYTAPASLTGNPAISAPCGTVSDGRPVGIQFIAPHFEETRLFQIARCLERLG